MTELQIIKRDDKNGDMGRDKHEIHIYHEAYDNEACDTTTIKATCLCDMTTYLNDVMFMILIRQCNTLNVIHIVYCMVLCLAVWDIMKADTKCVLVCYFGPEGLRRSGPKSQISLHKTKLLHLINIYKSETKIPRTAKCDLFRTIN